MKFYVCEHCGRMMAEVKGGAVVSCCGEPMKELIPNTVEASVEKHLPVLKLMAIRLMLLLAQFYIQWKKSIISNGLLL